jgi:hypothetical protein
MVNNKVIFVAVIPTPVSVLLTKYCSGNIIKKNEVVGACSAYRGGERRIQGFGG